MTIDRAPFGVFEGRHVTAYTMVAAGGLRARLIDFGARLVELHVPDRAGVPADVVLGFDDLQDYTVTDTYFGATCGRYGNRIAGGRFVLDGRVVQVTPNEGVNHLHGGLAGFDRKVWDVALDEAANAITFSLVSPAGDEGFPGTLQVTSRYQLTKDGRLLVSMSATTDQPTILNMVHHSYWNMAGHASGSIAGQLLTIPGSFYTPVDESLLATGEIVSVAGTPFDFRRPKPVGQDIEAVQNAGFGRLAEAGGGYDHNWVLDGAGPDLHPVGTLHDPVSGRAVSIRSTEPGVQVYTGGYLDETVIGKGHQPYTRYSGVTFETQKFPGSPNFPHFPSTRLDPGQRYDHRMEMTFTPVA